MTGFYLRNPGAPSTLRSGLYLRGPEAEPEAEETLSAATALERMQAGVTRVTRRIEILNSDESIYDDTAQLVGGSITVDSTRDERRNIDCTILPSRNRPELLEFDDEKFWFDKVIRAYRGIEYQGATWETPVGTFMIDRATTQNFPGTISITGRDYTKKMMGSQILQPTTFAAGTSLDLLVRALAANAGVTRVITPWGPDDEAPWLDARVSYEPETTRWEIVKQVCLSHSLQVFFDAGGSLVVRPLADPYLMPPAFTFQTGATNGNVLSWTQSMGDAELFNRVTVRSEVEGTPPIYAEATVTDTSSPVHPSRIGTRTYPYVSEAGLTQTEADELAEAFLAVASLQSYELNVSAVVIPVLEAGEVVDIKRADDGPTRFLLSSFTIPLELAAMEMQAKRLVIVA